MQKESFPPELYKKYYIEKSDERRVMFKKLSETYNPQKGIYPGSFVHITPSFYIQDMTYIDSDKRFGNFFKNNNLLKYIADNKNYSGTPVINYFQADYTEDLPIFKNSFDIMFSFYAGFISQACKKYLKDKAILVCNNSHGDASIAYTDIDYSLTAVINRSGDNFKITSDNLGSYFHKKDGSPINTERVFERMIGENFIKKAYAYIFRYNCHVQ